MIIKNIVVFTYVGAFVVPVRILFSVSVMLSFIGTVVRVYEIKDMQHVANRGYSKRWKKKKPEFVLLQEKKILAYPEMHLAVNSATIAIAAFRPSWLICPGLSVSSGVCQSRPLARVAWSLP